MTFCLLMTLPKLNISGSNSTKIIFLPTMFLDINQNGDMEFQSTTVYVSLLVADGDVLLDTQDTSILIINSMTFHVSLQMEL